ISSKIEVTEARAGISLGGAIFKSKWPGELGGIGISASKDGFNVFDNYEKELISHKKLEERLSGEVELKMEVRNGGLKINFLYIKEQGDWIQFYTTDFDAAKYASWRRGYRLGIVSKGVPSEAS